MPLKQGKSRWAISLDDDSQALAMIDQVCKKLETTRSEATRYLLVALAERWDGNLTSLGMQSIPVPEPCNKPRSTEAPSPSKREIRVNDAAIDGIDLMD